MAMYKICRCGKVILLVDKVCDECKKKDNKRKDYYKNRSSNDAEYNKRHSFYQTHDWKFVRGRVMNEHRGIDIYQYVINKVIVLADTVHHIETTKDRWDLRLDMSNLIPISDASHKYIHRVYEMGDECKVALQDELRECMRKWNEMIDTPTLHKE